MNTTEETLSVNGVVLNTLAYNISTLAGRLRAPALRTENIQVPGRHGSLRTRRKFYDEGEIVLPMWVRDTDEDELVSSREIFYSNIDRLTKLFRPGSGLLEVIHTLPDSSTRRAMAECTEAIDLSPKGRGLANFSVALKVPSVFWEDTSTVSQDLVPPHTGPVSVLNGMTAPIEDAVFTVTGPMTNPRVESWFNGGALEVPVWFQYSGTVPAGQTLTIDCSKWVLTGGGGFTPVYANFTHAGSARWMVIEPDLDGNTPGLKVTGSATTSASKVTITARRKYLVG